MTKDKIALGGLLVCLSLGSFTLTSGCAGDRERRSTGAYIDDKGITTRVKTALFRDPMVSGFDVHVNTFRGEVQLSGFVDNPEQKQRAAEVAREIPGVRLVSNNLDVKPKTAVGGPGDHVTGTSGTVVQPAPLAPPPTTLAPVRTANPNDQVIQPAQPYNTLPNSTLTVPQDIRPVPSYQVTTSNGRATLRGTVATDAEKHEIEQRVRNMPGIRTVDNQLDVQSH